MPDFKLKHFVEEKRTIKKYKKKYYITNFVTDHKKPVRSLDANEYSCFLKANML